MSAVIPRATESPHVRLHVVVVEKNEAATPTEKIKPPIGTPLWWFEWWMSFWDYPPAVTRR